MMIVYGIKTCSTVRKYINTLAQDNVVDFHDYLSQGLSQELLQDFLKSLSWEQIINSKARALTSLDPADKEFLLSLSGHDFNERAYEILAAQPCVIKRPITKLITGYTINLVPVKQENLC